MAANVEQAVTNSAAVDVDVLSAHVQRWRRASVRVLNFVTRARAAGTARPPLSAGYMCCICVVDYYYSYFLFFICCSPVDGSVLKLLSFSDSKRPAYRGTCTRIRFYFELFNFNSIKMNCFCFFQHF